MAVLQDVIMRVKNTFIELRVRQEAKRRATFPRRKATTATSDNQETQDVVAVVSMAEDETQNVSARERVDSNGSTRWLSPRTRGDSMLSTLTFASVASNEADEVAMTGRVYSERTRQQWWFGRVWQLSRDRDGCRRLQTALDATTNDEDKLAMLFELQGHVQEASRCPNANYVLQKCIAVVKPVHLEFVIKETTSRGALALAMVSRHKYGCRIVQRLLEHCTKEQVHRLSDLLLAEPFAIQTCSHPFGNYVMQHLYQYGSELHRRQLVETLISSVDLAAETHVCTVIGKVLSGSDAADKHALAQALDGVPGLLISMSDTKAGNFTAKLARQILARRERL